MRTQKSETQKIDKTKLNLCIDIVLLLLIAPITGIGLLVKYVLLSGIQRNQAIGPGNDYVLWGLDRHDWGFVHLVLGILFLLLLLLHILLHWKTITCMFRRMFSSPLLRMIVAVCITVVSLLTLAFPSFIKPTIVEKESLARNRSHNAISIQVNSLTTDSTPPDRPIEPEHDRLHQDLAHNNEQQIIKGYMTLQEISNQFHIPLSTLTQKLNIPQSLASERLSRLKRSYAFSMSDIQQIIDSLAKTTNSQ